MTKIGEQGKSLCRHYQTCWRVRRPPSHINTVPVKNVSNVNVQCAHTINLSMKRTDEETKTLLTFFLFTVQDYCTGL